MATKASKAKTKAKRAASKVSSKTSGNLWLKRALYLAVAAVPAYFIFKHKAAVAAAAAIAYSQMSDVMSDVGHEIAEQAEVVMDKVRDLDIG